MERKKSYLIFVITFNWSKVHRITPHELEEKLQRDQLCPDVNEFFFFTWGHTSEKVLEGTRRRVQVRTYGLNFVRPILNVWALIRVPYTVWRYRLRPDVWLVYDFGMVPALWVCQKIFGGRLIMYVNNQAFSCAKTRRLAFLQGPYAYIAERIFNNLPEHFFTLNATMRDYLEKLGIPREKISFYTVNTIERDVEHIATSKKGLVRTQYRIPKENKILLTVARLEAEKNYESLLDLFATLPQEYVLLCLGEGSLRGELEARIKRLGIERRVHLPGFIERADIWNYYLDADAFVLLSHTEALGIVFWEAMYLGVPCIGSNVPGIVESLGSVGERGLLCRDGEDATGFAKKIAFCASESPERAAMLARAKEYVVNQLQRKETINDYLNGIGI